MNHDVVPVVYGGADYSKFAPAGSYIDYRDFKSGENNLLIDFNSFNIFYNTVLKSCWIGQPFELSWQTRRRVP